MENSPKLGENPKKEDSPLKNYAYIAGVGMSLTTEMAVAGFAGWWLGGLLDQKFAIKPWGSIAGILLFIAGSMIHVVMTLQRLQRTLEKDDPKPDDQG